MKTKRLDYLIVGPALPYRGGISKTNHSLSKSLITFGKKVEIWTFKSLYPDFFFPGKSQYEEKEEETNLIIKRIFNTSNPLLWQKNIKSIIKLNPSFIVFRYWTPYLSPLYSTIAKNLPKSIKKIALVDNWIPHEKGILDTFLNKNFGRKIDYFVTFSKNVTEQITKNGFSNILTGFHPINSNLPKKISKKNAYNKLNLSSNYKYVLFFGIIRKYKGLDLLIRSFSEKIIRESNIKLIIVGEFYKNKNKYYNLINKLNLKSRIIIIPEYVNEETARDYFCLADLVAQTYISSSQSGVTAMSYNYKVPLLVTKINGLKDPIEVDKTGVVSNLNTKSISKSIIQILEKNNQKDIIDNIKKVCHNYHWDKFSYKLLNFINESEL